MADRTQARPYAAPVSLHPGVLPVLVARRDGDRWVVTCTSCGRENRHSAAVGHRHSHCRCPATRDGYVIAPPRAEHAPYPDHCGVCRRHFAFVDDDAADLRSRRLAIFTPLDLAPSPSGKGLVATYNCDWAHAWTCWWRDNALGNSTPPRPPASRRCALYRHFDKAGTLLYVGISEKLVARGKDHSRYAEWVRFASRVEAVWLDTREQAEAAERLAIRTERPIFNLAGAGPDAKAMADLYLRTQQ